MKKSTWLKPSSVEADVYVWRYALPVVHARKRRKEELALKPVHTLWIDKNFSNPLTVPPHLPWMYCLSTSHRSALIILESPMHSTRPNHLSNNDKIKYNNSSYLQSHTVVNNQLNINANLCTINKLTNWLVGWSLTSLFSTNTAISQTKPTN